MNKLIHLIVKILKTIHLGSIGIHFHHFLRFSPDSQKEETLS